MPKAAKLSKVYDIQEWRVGILLRYARLHRFSIIKERLNNGTDKARQETHTGAGA